MPQHVLLWGIERNRGRFSDLKGLSVATQSDDPIIEWQVSDV